MSEQTFHLYQSSTTDPRPALSESAALQKLDIDQLVRFHKQSSHLYGFAMLALLGAGLGIVLPFLPNHEISLDGLTIGLTGFFLVVAIGLIRRTEWGRIVGSLFTAILLVGFPIGTLIGIVGLRATLKAPELFGNARLTHKGLTRALKAAKAKQKQARRESKKAKRQR